MNPFPTDAFEDDLKAFLDGELPFLRRQQLRRHLKTCPRCREEIRQMQTLSEEIQTEAAEPMSAELRAKILENAPAAPDAKIVAPKSRKRTAKKLGLALAGVGLLAVGFQASQTALRNSPEQASERNATQSSLQEVPVGSAPATSAQPAAGAASSASTAGAVSAPKAAAPSAARAAQELPTQNSARAAVDAAAPRSSASSQPQSTIITGTPYRRHLDGSNYAFVDGHVKFLQSSTGDKAASNFEFAPPQRAVHREGNVTVAVDNAETASDAVAGIVSNAGGFVATNGLSTANDGRRSATLDVRIPVDKFEAIVAKIGGLGTVRAKNINGTDVTQQLTQANARRAAFSNELSISQTRLREKEAIAKKRDAGTIYQLRAEVRDARLRATQARAQWEYIRKYAALSTLYVVLQDKTKPAADVVGSNLFGSTGGQAWATFLSAAKLPLQLLIWILAYSPLWIPALLVWKKWGRKWLEAA